MTLPLVIVRPEPGASATLARAQERGFDAYACPLFAVAPLAWTPPSPAAFDALMLTSVNALRHGGPGLGALRYLPTYAVGDATAATAREQGFAVVGAGGSGAQALIDDVATKGVRRLLWLNARDATAFAPPAGLRVEAIAVYAADPLPPVPAFIDVLSHPVVALVHSARAGGRLAELAPVRAHTAIVAIGRNAARGCGAGWADLAIATTPDDDAMLELAGPMCQISGDRVDHHRSATGS